jgi:hypothetical protein
VLVIARALSAAFVLFTVSSARAAGGEDKVACAKAYESGQELRREGKLIAARSSLEVCVRICRPKLSADCVKWLDGIEHDLPTIVLEARDGGGRVIKDARVLVDGEPFVDALDGRAKELDPGLHRLRVEPSAGPPIDREILVRQGEKNRLVSIDLERTKSATIALAPRPAPPAIVSAPTERASRPVPILTWISLGAAIAGLAAFTYFGLDARSRRDELRDRCAPGCEPDEISPVSESALIADLSLAAAVVATIGGTWAFLARGPDR